MQSMHDACAALVARYCFLNQYSIRRQLRIITKTIQSLPKMMGHFRSTYTLEQITIPLPLQCCNIDSYKVPPSPRQRKMAKDANPDRREVPYTRDD